MFKWVSQNLHSNGSRPKNKSINLLINCYRSTNLSSNRWENSFKYKPLSVHLITCLYMTARTFRLSEKCKNSQNENKKKQKYALGRYLIYFRSYFYTAINEKKSLHYKPASHHRLQLLRMCWKKTIMCLPSNHRSSLYLKVDIGADASWQGSTSGGILLWSNFILIIFFFLGAKDWIHHRKFDGPTKVFFVL